MKRTVFPLLAVSLWLASVGYAATRPHYGGTLHVELRAQVPTLDPSVQEVFSEQAAQDHIASLIFEPLVKLDQKDTPQPALAVTWQHAPDFKSWQFTLRSYIKFHDGTLLTANRAVESLLKATNPHWRVHASGDDILVFESDTPLPNLPAELAQTRYAIAHGAGGAIAGTGPYQVASWQPGKQLVLKANDDYWDARPYIDSIEFTLGRSLRDQMTDLVLGRADLIEISLDQARRAAQGSVRVVTSSPGELFVLVFNSDKATVRDDRLREVIASSLDRASINNVLLQKGGEPSAALLPQWISGYAFLFPSARNMDRVVQLRAAIVVPTTLRLEYDFSDPIAMAMAERVAVNVREAGVNMQALGENLAAPGTSADLQLVRLRLGSMDASTALNNVTAALLSSSAQSADASTASQTGTPAGVYRAEHDLLNGFHLVPIAQVPEVWGLSGRVKNWVQPREGGWNLSDVWLEVPPDARAEGRP